MLDELDDRHGPRAGRTGGATAGRVVGDDGSVVACCRASGFAPEVTHTARSISSQLALVSSGLGVALVPRDSAASHLPAGVCLVALRASVQTELAALWRLDADLVVLALVHDTLTPTPA